MSFTDRVKTAFGSVKVKLAIAAIPAMGMVQYASAATLNASIGPVLDSVVELFVPLLALVTAAVPLMIIMAIIGFVLGILGAILGKLHV